MNTSNMAVCSQRGLHLSGFVRCILRALYSQTIVFAGMHLSNLVSRLRKTMIVNLFFFELFSFANLDI